VQDVIDDQAEVAGNRNGVRLSVLYLPIEGRTWVFRDRVARLWTVVLAADFLTICTDKG
jgi:hypothetical protein